MKKSSITNDDPLGSVLRWPTLRAKEWTKAFLESAQRDTNILAVIAIGSAVRPAVKSVDLDLIVISEEEMELNPGPPIEIDLRAYRPSEVHMLIGNGDDLLGWTLMFGKVLYQRRDYWNRLLSAWEARIPLPSYEIAITRARRALDRVKQMLHAGDENAASEIAVSYVTHLARAELLKAKQYPRSRPELSGQLRQIGATELAKALELVLGKEELSEEDLSDLLDLCVGVDLLR